MEYLDKLLTILTLDQWKALGFMALITSAITETCKRVFFIGMSPRRKSQYIYAVSFMAGIVAGSVGYFMVGTGAVPDYYWFAFGTIAGPASNLAHWLLLGVVAWKWPDLADKLKGKRR
jgi:hypothetical protein